jgi:hypothetical protein
MEIDKKDKYVKFGSFVIQKPKLYFDKMLHVKYGKSRGVVVTFSKAIPISTELQQVFINIIETNTLDDTLIASLSFTDVILMEHVLRKAKIIELLGYKRSKKTIMIETIRHRLFILQASIVAGNEGSEIYRECIELITKLHELDDLDNLDYFALKKSLKSV